MIGRTTEGAVTAPEPSPSADRTLTRRNEDTIAGLAMLLVSAVGFILTFWFDKVPAMLSQNIPPTFFPRLVLGTMGFLSVLLLLQGLRKREPRKAPVPPIVFVTAGGIVLAVLLLRPLGVPAVIFLACAALPLLWGERRVRAVLIFAALTPLVIYVLFAHLLQLRLPLGILEFIF